MKRDLYVNILKILLNISSYITVADIAEQLNVSSRTIYTYLHNDEFLQFISPCNLEIRQKQGIKLLGSKEQKDKIKKRLVACEQEKMQYLSALQSDDNSYILKVLFNTKSSCTGQQLAVKLYRSASNISDTMDQIETWLKLYGVILIRRNNVGCRLDGREENIRDAYKEYVLNVKLLHYNIILNNIDRLTKEHYYRLVLLFSKDEVDKIMQVLSLSEIVLNNKFTENDFYDLNIKLLVELRRIKIGKFVSIEASKLKDIPEFLAAQIIKNHLEDILGYKIPVSELYLLTKYLLMARKQKKDSNNEQNTVAINEITLSDFISHISQCLQVDLTKDDILLNNLILHLIPAVRRSKYGEKAENPLLNKIKYEYADVYLAVLTSIEELENAEEMFFDANEVGYICLHIVAAINRHQRGHYINACLVCDSGITITNYLESSIPKYLPEIEIIKSCVSSEFYQLKVEQYDLILDTTHLIRDITGKLIYINELFGKDDSIYIQNWILSQRLLDFNNMSPSLKDQVLYFHDDLPDRDTVLNKYGQYLSENGYVKKGYDKSLIERDQRVSTAMGRYVAVPHGAKDLVLKPVLAIVNLKRPILWDAEFRVDLIFIMAVNFAKVQINKYFFSKLYEIIKNEEMISAIKNSDDISEIEKLFMA